MLQRNKRFLLIAALFPAALCLSAFAQKPTAAPSSSAKTSLKRFLQNYLGDEGKTAQYSAVFVDLNGDGTQEVIIFVSGRHWCGSGGCLTLILAPNDSSYRVVTRITITRPPIRVLTTKSNGWRNISVWVGGGGIVPGYEAELPFDGKTYPSNPSMPSARQMITKKGKIVIPESSESETLFP